MRILALTLITATALSGCKQYASELARQLDREVGSNSSEATFGTAVAQNSALNRGAEGYRLDLDRRFAAEVNTMVNFEFNSANLDAVAQSTLREQASFIRQFPEVRFKVYGHTDLVGSNAYNRSLGLRRANAVVNYLVAQGISRSRLEAVVSLGETQPLVATPGRERANRRTVTEVSGFVEGGRPGELNGRYAEIIFRDYVADGAEARSTLSNLSTEGFGSEE